MIIQAYLQIPTEKLSTYKKNIIPYVLEKGGVQCGDVKKILSEVGKDVYVCDIYVYPQFQDKVIEAMAKERAKLEGK